MKKNNIGVTGQLATTLPDKVYFKIGEVVAHTNLKASVLRFWETEFAFLAPEKSCKGQRLYTKHDIDTILLIKRLLYTEKYTIDGVRNRLGKSRKTTPVVSSLTDKTNDTYQLLTDIRSELQAIKELL